MMMMDMDRMVLDRAGAGTRNIVYRSCLRRHIVISMLVVVMRLWWWLREWKEAVVLPRHDKAIEE